MMHISDIDSLTNFKRDTSKFLRRMSRTKRPMALTVNGKAKIVVMDSTMFADYEDYLEYIDTVKAVKRGLADVKAGRTKPMDEVFAELEKKFDFKL